jgi:16S rRNA (guanine1516-N2)-methyltransferase
MTHKQDTYTLIQTADYLGLQSTSDKKFTPFYIDFLAGKMRYRSDQAGLKREMLARALGKKPKDAPRIVDATAGLGRDGFILATLGFHVTLLERSDIIHALLADALKRAAADATMAPIIARMHLIHADASEWLAHLSPAERPDIIYLDPMFPDREKSASVKKEMVILQNLLENDEDNPTLLDTAMACSNLRVVVKRPRLAPTLTARKPDFALTGKSSRFDIYLV